MLASSNNDESVVTILGPAECVQPEAVDRLPMRLFRIADRYLHENSIHQAIEIYFELVEKHPDRLEAEQARQKLAEIGEYYESLGEYHQARALYERL